MLSSGCGHLPMYPPVRSHARPSTWPHSPLQVIARGHSRVPVYEESRQNIIGLILVKASRVGEGVGATAVVLATLPVFFTI